MAKVSVKKLMKQSAESLKDVMIDQLGTIADNMINQIMAKSKGLTYSNRLDALIGLTPDGINNYKSMLFDAMVIIANDGIDSARKEVPKAKKVKLSTTTLLKNLPPKLQDKIKTRNQLLIGKQVGDLQKTLEFAYATNEDTTDSFSQLKEDLEDSAFAWLDGTAVRLGADITAATIINESRNAFFMDDDVLEEIDAFEFVNGDPVSPICQDLAGTVFAKDDADMFRYTPPLHWNCKSSIQAILAGDLGKREIKKLQPSSAELEDSIQFSDTKHTSKCGHHHTKEFQDLVDCIVFLKE